MSTEMTKQHIKNFILDVDGTLWNTTEVVANAWNRAIIADGNSSVRVDAEILKTQFGKPMDVIAANLFTDVTPEIRENLLEECCKEEQAALKESTENLRYPLVRETMKKLWENGSNLYIVSNCQSGYIELVLEKNELAEFIEDYECFGNTKKSKAENIDFICKRNHLKKEETVYVGDTNGDRAAAKEAGISFIYAAYGFDKVENAAYRIETFSDLIHIS